MQSTFNLTSIVVTHEMESVEIIADTICVLHQGKVAGIGTYDELAASEHPYIQQFFARRPDEVGTIDEAYAQSLTGVGRNQTF
jgi:phospholipid/cholesterol/gamma-HCH transport system ATP-binding protein